MKKVTHKSSAGASYEKIAAIAKYYDEQPDDEVVAEIEAAVKDPKSVMVQVPRDLLPAILKLIHQRKKSA